MLVDAYVLIGAVIVICATIGLVAGKLDAKDYIAVIGLVLSFLSGKIVGIREGKVKG